jgi:hypothetical protein
LVLQIVLRRLSLAEVQLAAAALATLTAEPERALHLLGDLSSGRR